MAHIIKLYNVVKQDVRFTVERTNHSEKGGKGDVAKGSFLATHSQVYDDGTKKVIVKNTDNGKAFFVDGRFDLKPGMRLVPAQFADENNPLGLPKGFYPIPNYKGDITCLEIAKRD